MAVDSEHVYWSNAFSGTAFRCPVAGPFPCDSPTTVVSGEDGISGIALQIPPDEPDPDPGPDPGPTPGPGPEPDPDGDGSLVRGACANRVTGTERR